MEPITRDDIEDNKNNFNEIKNKSSKRIITLMVIFLIIIGVAFFLLNINNQVHGDVIEENHKNNTKELKNLSDFIDQLREFGFVKVNLGENHLILVPLKNKIYDENYEIKLPIKFYGYVSKYYAEERFYPETNNSTVWIIGDPHVHHKYCDYPNDLNLEVIRGKMYKYKINFSSLLIWNKGLSNEEERNLVTGKDHPISEQGKIIHPDVEISYIPTHYTGHLVVLGLNSLDFLPDPNEPKTNVVIINELKKKQPQVIIGHPHVQMWPELDIFSEKFVIKRGSECCGGFTELPIHVARGNVDFIETEGVSEELLIDYRIFDLWSKMLNSGFRIPVAAASDFPCIRDIGLWVTYVPIEGEATYEKFIQGIKKGRTVISNNEREWINLEINGKKLGEEIHIHNGQKLNLKIETFFSQLRSIKYINLTGFEKDIIVIPKNVEIIINGKVVRDLLIDVGRNTTYEELKINESSWIIIRSPHAVTSPIYVIVDNKPIRTSPEDACYLMRYVELYSRIVEKDMLDLEQDKDTALKAYAEARNIFEQRFKEAGGKECGELPRNSPKYG